MSDIFVSYANEDRDRIMPLVHALEKAGWSVFWDRTIPVGGTWQQVIGKEIDTCRCMVVVWSATSVKKEWVYEEASEGKRRGVLAPAVIDDILPPIGFRSIQAAKLVDWDGKAPSAEFDRLLNDLSNILGTAPTKIEEEQQRQAEEEAAKAREQAAKEAEVQRRQEAEAVRRAEQEAQRKAEAEQQQHAEQEARRKAEEKRKQEEEATKREAARAPASESTEQPPRWLYGVGALIAVVLLVFFIAPDKPDQTITYREPEPVSIDDREIRTIHKRLEEVQGIALALKNDHDSEKVRQQAKDIFLQLEALGPKVKHIRTLQQAEEFQHEINEIDRQLGMLAQIEAVPVKTGRLFVETEPGDARVKILNIGPKFYQGIELEPSRYHVEVSASGHDTKRQWVELGAGEDKYIDIRLVKLHVGGVCAPCHIKEINEMQNYPSRHATEVTCTDCHDKKHGDIPECNRYIPECSACHESHSPEVQLTSGNCMTCHPVHKPTQISYAGETESLICAGCHNDVNDMLQKKETKHTLYVNCAECHPTHKEIHSCSTCHGEPHPKTMMRDVTKCGDCHGSAHSLN